MLITHSAVECAILQGVGVAAGKDDGRSGFPPCHSMKILVAPLLPLFVLLLHTNTSRIAHTRHCAFRPLRVLSLRTENRCSVAIPNAKMAARDRARRRRTNLAEREYPLVRTNDANSGTPGVVPETRETRAIPGIRPSYRTLCSRNAAARGEGGR